MYTLHYTPGACSLIVHVLLEELGVAFELRKADGKSPEYRAGINPKGKVPALETPQGVITESMAMSEYLCDHHGGGRLLGKPGSWERARTLERVATLATEMQPVFNRYFHADDFSTDAAVQEAVKAHAATKLIAWFREQDAALATPYWSGGDFNLADIYFTVMTRWGRWLEPPANEMRNIRPAYERAIARPSFHRAMGREGVKAFGTA
jgi:glutathione S-transferase